MLVCYWGWKWDRRNKYRVSVDVKNELPEKQVIIFLKLMKLTKKNKRWVSILQCWVSNSLTLGEHSITLDEDSTMLGEQPTM